MDESQGLSESLSPKLVRVIEEELAAVGGGFISGFVGMVTYIDNDGDRCYSLVTSSIPAIDALGIVTALDMVIRADSRRALGLKRIEDS